MSIWRCAAWRDRVIEEEKEARRHMTTITIVVADWFLWWFAAFLCVTAGLAVSREYHRWKKPKLRPGGAGPF